MLKNLLRIDTKIFFIGRIVSIFGYIGQIYALYCPILKSVEKKVYQMFKTKGGVLKAL